MALWTCPTHGERYRPCCRNAWLATALVRAVLSVREAPTIPIEPRQPEEAA